MITPAAADFEVVVESKIRHGILWDLVNRLGGRQALADEIGVTASCVSLWLNLRTMPHLGGKRKRTAKQEAVCLRLAKLAGCPIEDIFPEFIREKLADIPIVDFRRLVVSRRALEAEQWEYEKRMTLPSPEQEAIDAERAVDLPSLIGQALRILTSRDRQAVALHYGLDGEEPHTIGETGEVLGVGTERVRQLIVHAVRRILAAEKRGSGFTAGLRERL